MRFRYLAALAGLALPSAAQACNPTAMLEGGGGSVNYKSALDGSSNCFFSNGLVDGTGALLLPNAAALADGSATPTTTRIGSLITGYNGTTWDFLRTVGTGILKSDTSTIAGTAAATGHGISGAGVQRVELPTDGTGVVGLNAGANTIGNVGLVAGAASVGTVGLNAGTNLVGKVGIDQTTPGTTNAVAQNGTWTVQPGNTPNTTPWLTQNVPQATGGMSVKSFIVANNTTSFAVDTTAARTLYGIAAFSISNTAPAFVKLFNTAQGSVTCGTTTPVDRMVIPANQSQGAGFIWSAPLGVAYGTAITACVTGGLADNDTTAPAASTFLVSFYYK